MRDVLGFLEGAAYVDALTRGLHRPRAFGLYESVLVQGDAQPSGQGNGLRVGCQADGQHHQIEHFFHSGARFGGVNDAQPVIFFGKDRVDARAHETHPVIVCGTQVVFVEILAEGAHVHEENGCIQRFGAVFLGDDGLLVGIHAAHR